MKDEQVMDELTETITFRIAMRDKIELIKLAHGEHMTMGDVMRAMVRERIERVKGKTKR